jgi:sporulation integral membrane protein YlbJ
MLTLCILSFLYLLCFPAQAQAGARAGLLLWYNSILPVLFPFMLVSGIFLNTGLADRVQRVLARPFHALFGCSGYGAFAIFTGFLCGFPMGAHMTSDLHRQGKISDRESRFLCGFVNNVSPVFILSYLAADQMKQPGWGILFLINILGAALLYGLLSSVRFRRESEYTALQSLPHHTAQVPQGGPSAHALPSQPTDIAGRFAAIDTAINDSIQNILRLAAYIVLFSVISSALTPLADDQHPVLLFLISCIEITNGIRLIASSALPLFVRAFLATVLCASGGLCALMQTISVARMDRAAIKAYIKSRVMITLLSALLSAAFILFCFLFLGLGRCGIAGW